MLVRYAEKEASQSLNGRHFRVDGGRAYLLFLMVSAIALNAAAQGGDEPAENPSEEVGENGEAQDVAGSMLGEMEEDASIQAEEGRAEPMPEDEFDLQVRGLEERVTDLKEKIFQTKARLLLLQETVIGGDLSTGARAVLVHCNEMGGSFVLESLTYVMDGAPIFTRVDPSGELDAQKEIEVFNGRIVPGMHQIGVRLVYRGSGYGVFSYLNDYRFRVQSSYTFDAEGGKVTRVSVVGFERGGLTTELQDRPAVRYEEEVTRELPGTTSHTVELEGER